MLRLKSGRRERLCVIGCAYGTNEVSEKLANHFKTLECCNTLPYEDFVFENKRPLKGLKGRAASYIAALNQTDNEEAFKKCYTETEKLSAH